MHVMARTPPLAILAALGGALLAGCDRPPTEPPAPAAPSLNFANGPAAAGLNVIRFSSNAGGFFIFDSRPDLLVVEGLPADPSTLVDCGLGGTNPASTLTYQQVGWLRGVIHNHVVGPDVTIHVFQLSDLVDGDFLGLFCTGTPLAAGTGRASIVDNDLFATSGRTNAVTFKILGTVTDLQTGARLHVTARAHTVTDLRTDPPTVKVDETRIRLQPVGGR